MCYSKSSNQLLHGFQDGQTGLHCAHLSEEHLSSWLIKLEITVNGVLPSYVPRATVGLSKKKCFMTSRIW